MLRFSLSLKRLWLVPIMVMAVVMPVWGDELPVAPACRFAGSFEQHKQLPDTEVVLSSEGQFLFDCRSGVIWQTLKPVQDFQVYRIDGQHYRVDASGDVQPVQQRFQRYIGQLMLALMGGENSLLVRDFLIERLPQSVPKAESVQWRLSPKRRRLKKLIDHIDLRQLQQNPQASVLQIQIHDTHGQQLTIVSSLQQRLDDQTDLASSCLEALAPVGDRVCQLLQ